MGDQRSGGESDKLNRTGEEPSVESGAGYGDHAPAPEDQHDGETEEP